MSLLILILTLAVYVIRPGEWVPGSEIRWNLILNVLGAIAILSAAMAGKTKGRADRTWLYMWVFFAWMLLSNLVQFQFESISLYFTDMLTNILVFMLVGLAIGSERSAKIVIGVFVVLILFVGFQCYLQSINGVNSLGVPPIERSAGYSEVTGARLTDWQVRWIGVFYDPNDTGMLFLCLAPLAFARTFFAGSSPPMRLLWASVFIIMVYCIYLTNSRGTFLALLGAISMLFIVKHRSIIGLGLAGLAGFALLALGPSRLSSVTSADDSAMERVYSWILALELFAMNPVLGVGPTHWRDHHHLTTHNSFVLAVVENGFPGYALYMAVFLTALYIAASVAIKSRTSAISISGAALVACLVGVMISAFFISRTYVLLPFFIAALVMAYCRVLDKAIYDEAITSLKLWWLGAAAAASIVFVWITNRLSTQLML